MLEQDTPAEVKTPVLGYLKTGAPSNGKGIGPNQDHWRFEPTDRYKLRAKPLFTEIYGLKPKQIHIYLAGHTPEEVFDQWMMEFGKKKDSTGGFLKKKCTTKRIVRWLREDQKPGEPPYSDVPIPCQAPKCNCQKSATLRFYIVELFASGLNQVCEFHTKSNNHIAHIQGVLEDTANLLAQFDRTLYAARFILERTEEKIKVPQYVKGEGGKYQLQPGVRDEKDTWMVSLTPDPEFMAQVMREAHQRAIAGQGQMLVLPGDLNYIQSTMPVLTAAVVEESKRLTSEEVVHLDARPKTDGKINGRRLRTVQNILGVADEQVVEVLNGKTSAELSEAECDRVIQDLMVHWAFEQKVGDAGYLFEDETHVRSYLLSRKIPEGSDKAVAEKWVEIVDGLRRSATAVES